jgi:hypothetical protein
MIVLKNNMEKVLMRGQKCRNSDCKRRATGLELVGIQMISEVQAEARRAR